MERNGHKPNTHAKILSHSPRACLDMRPRADQPAFKFHFLSKATICTTGPHPTKNNIYNITFTYPTPQGGTYQENKTTPLSGEKEMEKLLEEYQLFLGMNYRKKNTQIRYLNSAEKYLDYVQEINQEWTQRYIAFLHQTMRHNSVVSNIVGLNRFLEYIQRPDLRVRTPDWQPITRDTIRREDIIRIIQHAHKNYHYMDYLILLFIRDLDTRNHEIIKAQWSWIHGDKIQFQDCKTGDTTGRLTPELTEALQNWRQITPYPESPYIFLIPHGPFKGQPMSSMGWYIRSLVNRISLEVVGRRLNPQDLRASVITAEYTAYVNPKIIQLKARHRSEKTTMRYNHVNEELIQEYIQHGTIFTTDNSPVSTVLTTKPMVVDNNKRKRGCINTYPEDTHENENEDNTCFSFSYFLIITYEGHCIPSFGGVWCSDGITSDYPSSSNTPNPSFFLPSWGQQPNHTLGCVRFSHKIFTSVKQPRDHYSRLFLVHSQIPQTTPDLHFHWKTFLNDHKYVNTYMNIDNNNNNENGIVPDSLYILYIYYTFHTRGFFFGE